MDYREYPPAPDLAEFVRCFWSLTGTAAPGAAERVLPDGRLELVVHLGDPFDLVSPAGIRERQPRALFVGQQESHVLLEPVGRISVFGVCFHPDGAAAFARWPQQETAGRILPLEDLWGEAARSFEEQVRNAGNGNHSSRIAIAEGFLRRQMQHRDVDLRLRAAVDLIQREPWHRMAAIAEHTGASA